MPTWGNFDAKRKTTASGGAVLRHLACVCCCRDSLRDSDAYGHPVPHVRHEPRLAGRSADGFWAGLFLSSHVLERSGAAVLDPLQRAAVPPQMDE